MSTKIYQKLKKELNSVKKDESLREHTNFEIGGPARYLFEARKSEDIVRAFGVAHDLKIPYYILGGGSNLLASDRGFPGLVIKLNNNNLDLKNNQIVCGAGAAFSDLIKFSLDNDLEGLENFIGIPGTVGGAVYGNAGAFFRSIGDFVSFVKALNSKDAKTKEYSREECQFVYRGSVFKENRMIVLEAGLNLKKITDKKNLLVKIEKIKKIREKHPKEKCAGSIFKNIEFKDNKEITKRVPDDCVRFSEIKVACLIDKLGLKGKNIGGARISQKNANFIVNTGKAKAKDVLGLIKLIKKRVKKEYGLNLETEIQFVGF